LESRLTAAKCEDEIIERVRQEFDRKTIRTWEKALQLETNEVGEITVFREKSSNLEAKAFPSIRLETKKSTPGEWLVYYGFNYVEADDEEFFSQANPSTDPQTYTVTRFSDREGYEFSPSIYFMFARNKNHNNALARASSWVSGDWFGGITAGVGFDFDSPTAFLGYGIGYGYNVMLNAGYAMRKVDRLDGRYEVGQEIMEDLESVQLAESTYEPGFFVGLSFRFGSNPFSESGSAAAPQSPQNATSSDPTGSDTKPDPETPKTDEGASGEDNSADADSAEGETADVGTDDI
jgi:hypothetical protein